MTDPGGATGPSPSQAILYYDPTRVDYSVTEAELIQLATIGASHWRDITIGSGGVALSCLLNAAGILSGQQTFAVTPPLFLNAVIGFVALFGLVACGLAWRSTYRGTAQLIGAIKGKPPTVVTIGPALPGGPTGPGPSSITLQPFVPTTGATGPTGPSGPSPAASPPSGPSTSS